MMRTETVTLTNMCMVYDDAGNVLVQDKVDKKWSGLTFPADILRRANRLWIQLFVKFMRRPDSR